MLDGPNGDDSESSRAVADVLRSGKLAPCGASPRTGKPLTSEDEEAAGEGAKPDEDEGAKPEEGEGAKPEEGEAAGEGANPEEGEDAKLDEGEDAGSDEAGEDGEAAGEEPGASG